MKDLKDNHARLSFLKALLITLPPFNAELFMILLQFLYNIQVFYFLYYFLFLYIFSIISNFYSIFIFFA